jgi:hypothetical protein
MPGAWMYEVSWQRNGESVCRLNISATNGDDVLFQAEDFFARFPALDFRHECAGATVNIRLLRLGALAAKNRLQEC